MLFLDTLNYGKHGATIALTGIVSGYLWWRLEWKEIRGSPPPGSGRVLGRAPAILRWIIGDQRRREVQIGEGAVHIYAPLGRALNDGGRPIPADNGGYRGVWGRHRWGRGTRLGGE